MINYFMKKIIKVKYKNTYLGKTKIDKCPLFFLYLTYTFIISRKIFILLLKFESY